MDYRFSLVGLLIGTLVGLTGMGGGSLLAPIMILVFGIPPVWAVSTDIAYSTVTKAAGSVMHIWQKHVNFKVALWLACGSVPATMLSIFLVQYVHKRYSNLINGLIIHAVGIVLLLVAVVLLLQPLIRKYAEKRRIEAQKQAILSGQTQQSSKWAKYYRPLVTALVGTFVGSLVGFTSVGSGTLIIASLTFLYPKLGPKELVGTDVFQALLLLLAGSIALLYAGTINWGIAGLLLIGSIPGVLIGSRLSKYIPNRYMRPVLATVLVISGWKLI